jgi:hypothetical protein
MSMYTIFVTLAKLSVSQKLKEVVPYDNYNLNEENCGEDPDSEYDCK